ncbi:hypothetical protein IHQ71_01290 [Rhizobium sp. TH2]|uniref:hypothetical protein n=1 Tax=Rhizobium sp. TH2 TaxID=2775403 RepID=UPI0021584898|nr:hypothetical protein [Rhizobium sp. TH2]UVC09294.1 hypothetical protein IHQ71_01290 [Rhizobium sp. TH2]
MDEDRRFLRQRNFKQISSRLIRNSELRAISEIRKMTPEERRIALRDWRIKPIYKKSEVKLRDDLDNVLHACGIFEVGFMLGVIEPNNSFLTDDIVPLLELTEVKTYYTDYYPIALPSKFLRRLNDRGVIYADRFDTATFDKLLCLKRISTIQGWGSS